MNADAYCFHRRFEPSGPSTFRMDRHYLLHALDGSLRLEAGRQRWTLPPARAALIAADNPVQITVLTPLTSASVLFVPSFVPAPPVPLSVFDMTPLARALVEETTAFGPDTPDLSPYARKLFSLLADVVLQLSQSPSPCVLPVAKSAELARAVTLTEARASDDPTFAQIARDSGQSERALARRFSDEFGMTWSETLRRIRVIRAVEALADPAQPITEIAYLVGYGSVSAFNAAFREIMGRTPRDYRASFQRMPPAPSAA